MRYEEMKARIERLEEIVGRFSVYATRNPVYLELFRAHKDADAYIFEYGIKTPLSLVKDSRLRDDLLRAEEEFWNAKERMRARQMVRQFRAENLFWRLHGFPTEVTERLAAAVWDLPMFEDCYLAVHRNPDLRRSITGVTS